jgi:hypothetical protein
MANLNLGVTRVTCRDGTYLVDERLVRRIIESYFRAKAIASPAHGKEVIMETEWYEPTIKTWEVDWQAVRSTTEQNTIGRLCSKWLISLPLMQPRIADLLYMQTQTANMTAAYRKKLQSYNQANMAARDSIISAWETAEGVATFLRDASATTLMVGATVMSAGTAAVVAGGAGTALKFTAKLQDGKGKWQDHIGAASVQAVGDMIFTIIPATKAGAVMRGAKGAQEGAIMFLEAAWDTSVSLLEGKEMTEALLDGALTLGVDSASKKISFTKEWMKGMDEHLSGWMLPTTIRFLGDKKTGVQAAKIASGTVKKYATSGVKTGVKAAVGGQQISQNILNKETHKHGLDNAVLVDRGLVARAVRKVA